MAAPDNVINLPTQGAVDVHLAEAMTYADTRQTYWSADELMRANFPEPRWAVPGLICEGVNLLVGAPKLGKSWLCLAMAIDVANGMPALGKIEVEPGTVLYVPLEDTLRRLHSRLEMALEGRAAPPNLKIMTSMARLPEGAEQLDRWLTDHPAARLVIIDVLLKVRPLTKGSSNAYEQDYATIASIKETADKHSVAVLLVHHTRKDETSSDVFDQVSGSNGLMGAADATLILTRARNSADATLHITGRDVQEAEYALTRDGAPHRWVMKDEPPAVARLTGAPRQIHDLLMGCDEPMAPKAVGEALGLKDTTTRGSLKRLADRGLITQDGAGNYTAARAN